MKNRLFSSCPLLGLGLLIVLTPYVLFPVCPGTLALASGTAVPMKCFWTARAAAGLGCAVLFAGGLLVFAASPGVRLGVALMLLPLSALTAAVPLGLVGVCMNEMMPCRMGTLPALCLLGLFTAFTATAIALNARKAMRRGSEAAWQKTARTGAEDERGAR